MTELPATHREIEVLLERVETPPQVRLENNPGFAEPVLLELGHSLQKRQLSAIGVRRNLEKEGYYFAVYGFRRLLAAKLVKMATIRAIVLEDGMTESQIKVIQLIENMQRSDLTGYEKWNACNELLVLNPEWRNSDLANALALDASMITRITSASRTLPAVQDAFKAGRLDVSKVYAISRVTEIEQHAMLAAALNGASREALEHAGRRSRNPTPVIETIKKIKCVMDGGIVQMSGKDLTLEDFYDLAQSWCKRAKKAIEAGWGAKTLEQACKAEAGA